MKQDNSPTYTAVDTEKNRQHFLYVESAEAYLAERAGKFVSIGPADKPLLVSAVPANAANIGRRFVFDPATRALIVTPDLDAEIRQTLIGEARRITSRLYLKKALLYPEFLWLKTKSVLLDVTSMFFGFFFKKIANRHE